MRTRPLTLPAVVAAVTLGMAALATLATPAVAEEPPATPGGHPAAYVSIEEGPAFSDSRVVGIALRYSCYGGPTTVSVTVTAGPARASGSREIPCRGEVDLPVGLGLAVAEGDEGFPPGVYVVEVRASIPGQASLVTGVRVEGPPALAPVVLTADASPEEVTWGTRISVTGVARRGSSGDPVALRTALEFRPDGGDWRRVRTVTSTEAGMLDTKVTARRSGNFRFRYAGSPTDEPATSVPDHVVVRPKPRAYRSCSALTAVYRHGVGRSGATETGLGVTRWTRDTATYERNTRFDRDQDGVACERA